MPGHFNRSAEEFPAEIAMTPWFGSVRVLLLHVR